MCLNQAGDDGHQATSMNPLVFCEIVIDDDGGDGDDDGDFDDCSCGDFYCIYWKKFWMIPYCIEMEGAVREGFRNSTSCLNL